MILVASSWTFSNFVLWSSILQTQTTLAYSRAGLLYVEFIFLHCFLKDWTLSLPVDKVFYLLFVSGPFKKFKYVLSFKSRYWISYLPEKNITSYFAGLNASNHVLDHAFFLSISWFTFPPISGKLVDEYCSDEAPAKRRVKKFIESPIWIIYIKNKSTDPCDTPALVCMV